MMMGKTELRINRPRDGRHCDLCGCSFPAVRCDKCGSQIFCLSCDDMYHRHPKRRFHLRKAVDTNPTAAQARPVLPIKASHLPPMPGDPSKMPLPPPRKKKPAKSFFDTFRKGNHSAENSPSFSRKEYSWTDKLGSIKKFMSNRPLPPLPNEDDLQNESPTVDNVPVKHDLSFIHRRVNDKPPQLPQRMQKFPNSSESPESNGIHSESLSPHVPTSYSGEIVNGSSDGSQHNKENHPASQRKIMVDNHIPGQHFGTINHQNQHMHNFKPPGPPGYSTMQGSASTTDLHELPTVDNRQMPHMPPVHYPHYPMNPHLPPHYPYPMYPQYPNYPQYFGNSWTNLSHPPSDNEASDHSDASSRRSSNKKQSFRKRAKRSQSVMVDRMPYVGHFPYPYPGYPAGYGPGMWAPPPTTERSHSPSGSVHSLSRINRTKRRGRTTSDDEYSLSSSPLSRPKSSSSDKPPTTKISPGSMQSSSSDEEIDDDKENRRNQKIHKHRESESGRASIEKEHDNRELLLDKHMQKHVIDQSEGKSSDDNGQSRTNQRNFDVPRSESHCRHCTFINPIGERVCQVCCKTLGAQTPTLVDKTSDAQSDSPEKCGSSPDKPMDDNESYKRNKQDMAILNSALDEAEKEISRGLEELMKLNEETSTSVQKEEKSSLPIRESETSKPVYKSTGKMRNNIFEKLGVTPGSQKISKTSVSTSTSTETQTVDEGSMRRTSVSSASDTYNSPLAQSPTVPEKDSLTDNSIDNANTRRDSSCQTQQDNLADYLHWKKNEEAFLARSNIENYPYKHGRLEPLMSPIPAMYERGFGSTLGLMQRSHSRASLFSGRLNDSAPFEYGNPGFGFGPMYRSASRSSLSGDFPENRLSDFQNLRRPDYYLSLEELVERRRQESLRAQGLELVRMIREAEQQGFTADDIQVALNNCGKQNPVDWLQENWKSMVESVITLSTNYGNNKKENDIGVVSEHEARDALRLHKGNIWAAVTECVEGRQRKFLELSARGKFSRKNIIGVLTSSQGDVELAYEKLTKSSTKPFLMRIWGVGEGAQNEDGAIPQFVENVKGDDFKKDSIQSDDYISYDSQSDELYEEGIDEEEDIIWDDEEVEYDDDFEKDIDFQEIQTVESDRSDYGDDFASGEEEKSISSVSEISGKKKSMNFLKKLAAIRKEGKKQCDTVQTHEKSETSLKMQDQFDKESSSNECDKNKGNGPLNLLKNTLNAIRDTVTGSSKNSKKIPISVPETRTIVINSEVPCEAHVPKPNDEKLATSLKETNSNTMFYATKECDTVFRERDSREVLDGNNFNPSKIGINLRDNASLVIAENLSHSNNASHPDASSTKANTFHNLTENYQIEKESTIPDSEHFRRTEKLNDNDSHSAENSYSVVKHGNLELQSSKSEQNIKLNKVLQHVEQTKQPPNELPTNNDAIQSNKQHFTSETTAIANNIMAKHHTDEVSVENESTQYKNIAKPVDHSKMLKSLNTSIGLDHVSDGDIPQPKLTGSSEKMHLSSLSSVSSKVSTMHDISPQRSTSEVKNNKLDSSEVKNVIPKNSVPELTQSDGALVKDGSKRPDVVNIEMNNSHVYPNSSLTLSLQVGKKVDNVIQPDCVNSTNKSDNVDSTNQISVSHEKEIQIPTEVSSETKISFSEASNDADKSSQTGVPLQPTQQSIENVQVSSTIDTEQLTSVEKCESELMLFEDLKPHLVSLPVGDVNALEGQSEIPVTNDMKMELKNNAVASPLSSPKEAVIAYSGSPPDFPVSSIISENNEVNAIHDVKDVLSETKTVSSEMQEKNAALSTINEIQINREINFDDNSLSDGSRNISATAASEYSSLANITKSPMLQTTTNITDANIHHNVPTNTKNNEENLSELESVATISNNTKIETDTFLQQGLGNNEVEPIQVIMNSLCDNKDVTPEMQVVSERSESHTSMINKMNENDADSFSFESTNDNTRNNISAVENSAVDESENLDNSVCVVAANTGEAEKCLPETENQVSSVNVEISTPALPSDVAINNLLEIVPGITSEPIAEGTKTFTSIEESKISDQTPENVTKAENLSEVEHPAPSKIETEKKENVEIPSSAEQSSMATQNSSETSKGFSGLKKAETSINYTKSLVNKFSALTSEKHNVKTQHLKDNLESASGPETNKDSEKYIGVRRGSQTNVTSLKSKFDNNMGIFPDNGRRLSITKTLAPTEKPNASTSTASSNTVSKKNENDQIKGKASSNHQTSQIMSANSNSFQNSAAGSLVTDATTKSEITSAISLDSSNEKSRISAVKTSEHADKPNSSASTVSSNTSSKQIEGDRTNAQTSQAMSANTNSSQNSASDSVTTRRESSDLGNIPSQSSSEMHTKVTPLKSEIIPLDSLTSSNNIQGNSSLTKLEKNDSTETKDSDSDSEIQNYSVTFPSIRNRVEDLKEQSPSRSASPIRPQSPFGRMSFIARKEAIAQERIRDSMASEKKPWFSSKPTEPTKYTYKKRSIKQQLELERKMRKMVSDGKCRTYKKAEVVIQLMDMNFEEEEAVQAANECGTLEQAISYLQQECLLCAGNFPVSQIISMVHCQHKACRECIRAYFTVQIRDRTIMELLCPFCNEPDIGDEDVAQDYFNHLDIMLKKLVDIDIHELFQRKLRDRVLMRDPNFRWCSQCSSGFISEPHLKRLVCPDCNAVTCASCRRLWEKEHQNMTCDAFAAWKDSNDPEAQAAGLAKLLAEDGIDCPSCRFRYSLAKGGCMHFKCIQCQHDFCSGCSRPFKMGQKCGVSEFCAKLGLHAHHPRNCLFYLRDKEPEDLQRLLDLNSIIYNKEPPDGMEVKNICQVMEQKETADGMFDDYCSKEVQNGYAGLCRIHYVEYLGQLVNKHKVDPIQIFDNDDLELVLRRANIRLPAKRYGESDFQYRNKLVKMIQEELSLDKTEGGY